MTVIGSASIQILPDTSTFTRGLRRQVAGAGAALGAALGVTNLVKSIGTIGVAYQDTLNTFSAVANKAQLAAAGGLGAVSAKAKELGNDLTLPATSAADAGQALTELAKAGLSVRDSLAAGKGALQLATAGTLDAGQAAGIAANALNTFGLAGDQATRVANVLANAANVSSGEVTDFAQGLAQVGTVANNAGLSIEQTTGALALFANAGIKGSDAGTSLKTFLLRLTPASAAAGKAMDTLGFKTRDAGGKFLPFDQIVQNLQSSFSGLTDEQRDANLQTIFGQDAIRAAQLLYKGGGDAVDKYATAVGRAGGAAEVAAAKSKGLGGAFRGLQSQLETAEITVFEKVSPSLERAVRAVSDKGPGFVKAATGVVGSVGTALAGLAQPLIDGVTAPITAAFDTVRQAFLDLTSGLAGPVDAPGLRTIQDNAEQASGVFGGLGETIRKAIDDGIAALDPGDIGKQIGSLLASAAGTLTSNSAQFVAAVGRFMADTAPLLAREFGREAPVILLGLATGLLNFDVGSIFGFVGDHLFEVIIGIITLAFLPTKLLTVFGRIPIVGTLVETVARGAVAGSRGLLTAAGRLLAGFIDGLEASGPRLVQVGARVIRVTVLAIVGFVRTGVGLIADGFRAAPGAASRALSALPGTLGRIAGQAVGLFMRSLLFLPRQAFALFSTLFPGIARILGSIPGRMIALGAAVVAGFSDGIRGAAGRLISAVRDAIVDKLPAFVRKALGIHSPSRVFMDIGAQVPAGMALGIRNAQGQVTDALVTMLDLPDPTALGLAAGDLAAAATRAAQSAIDKALITRDAVVTSRGPAAAAASAAATAASAATATATALAGRSVRAAAAVAKLNQQLTAARAAAAAASREGLAHARALSDQAHAAEQYAASLPAATKAQKAAKAAAEEHAQALANAARQAGRSKQTNADAAAAAVAALVKQRDAAAAAAKAAKDAADKAGQAAKDRISTAKDTAEALQQIDEQLASAQTALADAVVEAQADAAKKARDAAVADGQAMLDIYSGQVDDLVARSSALTGAFRDSVMAGAGLGDVFSSVKAGLDKAVDDAQASVDSTARDVVQAQQRVTQATEKYTAALAKQREELAQLEAQEARQRQTLAAATLTREEAERRLTAARAVATDGAAASAFELADLRGAYDAYLAAQKAEQDAQDGVNDAAAKTSETRSQQLSELADVTEAQAALTEAQTAAAAASSALASAQAGLGTVVAQVLQTLKDRLADAQQFAGQVGSLAGLGLNDNLLAEIAKLGPQAGSALAAGIIATGPPTVAQINQLTSDIGVVASTGLDAVAETLFGKGADTLASLVEGIRSRFPELDSAVQTINDKLASIAAGERAVADAQAKAAAAAVTARLEIKPVAQQVALYDQSTTTINGSGLSQQQLTAALNESNALKTAERLRLLKQGVR